MFTYVNHSAQNLETLMGYLSVGLLQYWSLMLVALRMLQQQAASFRSVKCEV